MARKASSRKPTLALPKPFARSPTARGKPARGLSAPEAADAAQQGLLQLSFARHAHGYGHPRHNHLDGDDLARPWAPQGREFRGRARDADSDGPPRARWRADHGP